MTGAEASQLNRNRKLKSATENDRELRRQVRARELGKKPRRGKWQPVASYHSAMNKKSMKPRASQYLYQLTDRN
jgi:hypothetical protein